MSELIRQFELDCIAAKVSPPKALKAGGVHESLWWKWKEDKVSPTLRNFERARTGLRKLAASANDDSAAGLAA